MSSTEQQYVVVYRSKILPAPMVKRAPKDVALRAFDELVAAGHFRPESTRRVCVMSIREWEKVQAEQKAGV